MIRITDSEWRVMEVLWKESPMLTKEIKAHLLEQTWTIATVKTLVNRLLKKNAIGYHVNGKSYLYYPLISKEEAVKAEQESFIQKVFKGSKKDLIMNLVGDTTMTKDEIEELRQLLEKKREK